MIFPKLPTVEVVLRCHYFMVQAHVPFHREVMVGVALQMSPKHGSLEEAPAGAQLDDELRIAVFRHLQSGRKRVSNLSQHTFPERGGVEREVEFVKQHRHVSSKQCALFRKRTEDSWLR